MSLATEQNCMCVSKKLKLKFLSIIKYYFRLSNVGSHVTDMLKKYTNSFKSSAIEHLFDLSIKYHVFFLLNVAPYYKVSVQNLFMDLSCCKITSQFSHKLIHEATGTWHLSPHHFSPGSRSIARWKSNYTICSSTSPTTVPGKMASVQCELEADKSVISCHSWAYIFCYFHKVPGYWAGIRARKICCDVTRTIKICIFISNLVPFKFIQQRCQT